MTVYEDERKQSKVSDKESKAIIRGFSVQVAAIPKHTESVEGMILVESDFDPARSDASLKELVETRKAGEDAFCIVHRRNARHQPSMESVFEDPARPQDFNSEEGKEELWIAVADGVGGWAKHGIDPSRFSVSLMRNLANVLVKSSSKVSTALDALHRAYQGLLREALSPAENSKDGNQDAPLGSSTACLVHLTRDSLSAANLGDSGFMILRPTTTNNNDGSDNSTLELVASEPQQTRFNCPVQLKMTPEGAYHDITGSAGERFEMPIGRPSHWFEFPRRRLTLQPGDLVIVASDGLWDNLHRHEIMALVNDGLVEEPGNDEERGSIAAELALAAFEASIEEGDTKLEELARDKQNQEAPTSPYRNRNSPFSEEFNRVHAQSIAEGRKKSRFGGKVDDITVLVAKIR